MDMRIEIPMDMHIDMYIDMCMYIYVDTGGVRACRGSGSVYRVVVP